MSNPKSLSKKGARIELRCTIEEKEKWQKKVDELYENKKISGPHISKLITYALSGLFHKP